MTINKPTEQSENERLKEINDDLMAALKTLLADRYLADPINADRMAAAKAAVAKAEGRDQ